MLRAVVSPEGYQQVLAEVPDYEFRTVDLRGLDENARDERLRDIHEEMRDQVFDTAVWPLFDIRLTLVDGHRIRLHLGMDALISDAWSTSLLFREWSAAYHDEPLDRPADLGYRDYVLAVRALAGGPLHGRAMRYWQERVPTLPPAPELPLATNPAALAKPVFAHRSFRLDADAWARCKRRAAEAGVTPSAAVCTAYAQVLAAWSKSSRFTLDVLFFNRLPLHPDVAKVVGNFSATTLLEIEATAFEAFAARAVTVQKQLWNDLEHSHVSGVAVLRELNRVRGTSARASMPVVFASTVNFAAREDVAGATGLGQHLIALGTSGREVSSSIRTPQVWLDHQVVEDAGELIVNWDVVEELFPAGMIDAMFGTYRDVLRQLCDDEQSWQRPAPVLVPAAQLDARFVVNTTAGPLSRDLLHDGFRARAAADPDRVAVIAPDRTLTYGELDRLSNQLHRLLRRRGVRPGDLVGVVMEKGWEQVAATLGILKAGGVYVPIDAAVPPERLRLLLANAAISVVLTQTLVDVRTAWPDGVVALPVDGPDLTSADDQPLPAPEVSPTDLAYVIFTSGSTGQPKGVMIEHAGAVNTIRDINDRFRVTADDRVLALSALNFDLSVYDIFGLLAAGGAIVLPEPSAYREPARWAELVSTHRVTLWNSVPALMEMFVEHLRANGSRLELPLRLVMMSGDWIPVTLPDRIRGLADAEIWSLGGATEASIWSILYPIGTVEPDWTSIPYGRPMANQQFHVLNEAMQPCPVWVPGQLHIGGAGLARGYLGDAAKTAASFIRHPLTGERLYRTGDLGRYLPSGDIEFMGREDHQVKVQGYRIELGEIEAAVLRCPGIRNGVVVAVGERQAAKRLVAYVVPDDGYDGAVDLTALLRKELPEYMVPQQVVVIDELPVSANGKGDRTALPEPDGGTAAGRETVLARDEVEARLVEIWEEFFPVRPVQVRASFFELGGDSLLAVRLVAQIQRHFGQALPLSVLFARPTIELLAQLLRDSEAQVRRGALVTVRESGTRPPLFFVHPVGGDVLCYAELAAQLGDRQPFYGLQVPDLDRPLETVAGLAAHYAEAVVAAAPEGPYRLGGWSMGGVIALEMARQLAEAGRAVELVLAVDLLEPPGPAREPAPGDAALLCWFARDLAGLARRDWQPVPGDLSTPDGRAAIEVLHAEAVRHGVLPPDIDLETLRRIVDRFTRNSRALLTHEPRPYDGRVRLFRAVDGGASADTTARWLRLLSGDARAVELPGDHYSVMRQPHATDLGAALRTELDTGEPR